MISSDMAGMGDGQARSLADQLSELSQKYNDVNLNNVSRSDAASDKATNQAAYSAYQNASNILGRKEPRSHHHHMLG